MNMQNSKTSGNRSRTLPFALAFAILGVAQLGWAQAQPKESTAPAVAAQPAAPGTLNRIRANGKLVLGYYTNAQPMSYRDPSGNAAGYAVTLCKKIAEDVKAELSMQMLAVEWVPLTPATGMQNVQQGKIDLLCGSDAASLTNRANVSFSLPIFPGGISALVRSDSSRALQNVLEERPTPYKPIWRASPFSPLQHRTLSVVAGTPTVDWAKDRASKLGLVATLDTVDSYDTGVTKVVKRKSDVLFGDRAVLLGLAKRSPDAGKLRVLTRHFTYEPLALALPRNDDDFRLVVDRALTRFYASPKFGDAYAAVFGQPDADTVEYFRSLVVDPELTRFYASPKFGDAYAAVFGQPDADTVEYFRNLPR
jgi:putrescine:ornithine antiporter